MSWKGEIKQFACVDIGGKTVLVFREKYVRKATAHKVLDLFLNNYEKLDDENKKTYDFLIIEKKGRITASYKKGNPENAPVVWLKNVEFKDITIADTTQVITNKYDKPIMVDANSFTVPFNSDFYNEK